MPFGGVLRKIACGTGEKTRETGFWRGFSTAAFILANGSRVEGSSLSRVKQRESATAISFCERGRVSSNTERSLPLTTLVSRTQVHVGDGFILANFIKGNSNCVSVKGVLLNKKNLATGWRRHYRIDHCLPTLGNGVIAVGDVGLLNATR